MKKIAYSYGLIELLLVVIVFWAGWGFAFFAFKVNKVAVNRPYISAKASYKQVKDNFRGEPYAKGAFSELPGFYCEGFTAGKNNHGWIVLRCRK